VSASRIVRQGVTTLLQRSGTVFSVRFNLFNWVLDRRLAFAAGPLTNEVERRGG
jgi:hypothetical protein